MARKILAVKFIVMEETKTVRKMTTIFLCDLTSLLFLCCSRYSEGVPERLFWESVVGTYYNVGKRLNGLLVVK